MRLTVETQQRGKDAYLRALRRVARRAGDLSPLMDSIGMGLEASVRERFAETSTAPDATRWDPSIADAEGRKTLVDSGNLADSITHAATRDSVVVGTNVLYAAIHQLGGTIEGKTSRGLRFQIGERWANVASVTIPARPFMGLSDDDESMILAEATDWLEGAFAAGGAA